MRYAAWLLVVAAACRHQLPAPTGDAESAVIPVTRAQLSAALGAEVMAACPEGTACTLQPVNGMVVWLREDGSALVLVEHEALWLPEDSRHWRLQGDRSGELVPFDWQGQAPHRPHFRDIVVTGEPPGRPVLGVLLDEHPSLVMPVASDEQGLRVLDVVDWSPAITAGVRPGDIVVAVDGVGVSSKDQLRTALQESAGEILLELARDDERVEVRVAPLRRRLRFYKLWSDEGRDVVLEQEPDSGVEVACPPGAIDVVLQRDAVPDDPSPSQEPQDGPQNGQ